LDQLRKLLYFSMLFALVPLFDISSENLLTRW
jgi:hypothetical protein